MNANTVTVPESELYSCGEQGLLKVGVNQEHIKLVLYVLITADLHGIDTHGTGRLIPYIKRIKSGLINAKPEITVKSSTPAISLIDGDDGSGPVVGMIGLTEAIKAAKKYGIAFAGCHHSHHFGAGSPYALAACNEGLILIGGTNAFPSIAPTGAKNIILGNNPLFIGVPRQDTPHFILDIALSAIARGKIRKSAEQNKPIPSGIALDTDGKPTNDPVEALKGYVLPIANHKGYGLALAIDLIGGVLTGAGFGTGVLSLFQQWEKPQNVGHFFIVIDPGFLMEKDEFYLRSNKLFNQIKNSTPWDNNQPVMYPGEIEAANYEKFKKNGITFSKKIWTDLQKLADGIYDAEVSKL